MTEKEKRTQYMKEWRIKNREKYKEYQRVYQKEYYHKHKEKIKMQVKQWQLENPDKRAKYCKKYRQKYPGRYKAMEILNHAIERKGLAKPQFCSRCGGNGTVHGHHEDYSKPLDVEWLCAKCHNGVCI